MPRGASRSSSCTGKSSPTTPTTCTGWSSEAATAKCTAEPPSASAVCPKGVNTESSATLPTTSRLIESHPIRGAYPQQVEAVREHLPRCARKQQARALDGGCLSEDTTTVIPAVGFPGEVLEVVGDAMRLVLACSARNHLGIASEQLEQCHVGGLQHVDLQGPLDRVGSGTGVAEDAAHSRVRHLHVVDRVLVAACAGELDVEDQVTVTAAHQEPVPGRVDTGLLVQVGQCHELAGALRHLGLGAASHHLHELHQGD